MKKEKEFNLKEKIENEIQLEHFCLNKSKHDSEQELEHVNQIEAYNKSLKFIEESIYDLKEGIKNIPEQTTQIQLKVKIMRLINKLSGYLKDQTEY